jgi:DNA-directed RNA polymerase subunit RPC12/RpoP
VKYVTIKSKIKCPYCGFENEEEMPLYIYMCLYECKSCGRILKPKEGDRCVFCSYGDVKCPAKQVQDNNNR